MTGKESSWTYRKGKNQKLYILDFNILSTAQVDSSPQDEQDSIRKEELTAAIK